MLFCFVRDFAERPVVMVRILIVEDDRDAADALEMLLRGAGYDVKIAPSGSQALVALTEAVPDLIVLDLLMPHMDGADLLSVIRSYSRFRMIPVVVWTGAGDTAVVDRARRHEIKEIVMKGKANYNELLAAVDRVLEHNKSQKVEG